MKIKLLFIVLIVTLQSFAQVSVGPKHIGKPGKFKKGVLAKFKQTETIFVLSNIYDQDTYDAVLKDSWKVTPYKLISAEDFEVEKYLGAEYSVAKLSGFKRIKQMKSGGTSTSLFTYVDIKMYDKEAIYKKLDKLSEKRRAKKKLEIINDNSTNIARFYIFPQDDFIGTALTQNMETIVASLFTEDVFFNYKPGLLKNYFQKINNLLEKEEIYWMYEDDYLPELKNLASKKLYIPSYMTIKYNGWTGQDSEADDENITKIFKKYEHEYEIIKDEELSDKIMNNEDLYYLRYVRMNAERFLQVVNAKTGEIVYRNYITGLSYKIKAKHIADLNGRIKKALKK